MIIKIGKIEFLLTKHCQERMLQRNISIDRIKEAIIYGVKLINNFRRKDGTGRVNNLQYRFIFDGLIVIVEYEPFPRIITVI